MLFEAASTADLSLFKPCSFQCWEKDITAAGCHMPDIAIGRKIVQESYSTDSQSTHTNKFIFADI